MTSYTNKRINLTFDEYADACQILDALGYVRQVESPMFPWKHIKGVYTTAMGNYYASLKGFDNGITLIRFKLIYDITQK